MTENDEESDYERIGRTVLAFVDELATSVSPSEVMQSMESGMRAILDTIPKSKRRAVAEVIGALEHRVPPDMVGRIAENSAMLDQLAERLKDDRGPQG